MTPSILRPLLIALPFVHARYTPMQARARLKEIDDIEIGKPSARRKRKKREKRKHRRRGEKVTVRTSEASQEKIDRGEEMRSFPPLLLDCLSPHEGVQRETDTI